MRNKKIASAVLVTAGVLAAIAAVHYLARPAAVAAAAQSSNDKPTIYFVKNPEPTPAFQLNDLTGKPISTADWKGKAVLLNFWATWCPPCREEIPSLIALQKKYGNRLVIIGASEDEDPPSEVLKFVNKVGINYPVVMATEKLIAQWGGVEALPTTFLINPQGQVVWKQRGLHSEDEYDRDIKAMLGDPVDAQVQLIADQGQVFLKNAANATELPDVDLSKLTPEQKKVALHRLNAEGCTCGCKLTVAQCRLNDTTCPISKQLAAQIVAEVATSKPAAPAANAPAKAKTATSAPNKPA